MIQAPSVFESLFFICKILSTRSTNQTYHELLSDTFETRFVGVHMLLLLYKAVISEPAAYRSAVEAESHALLAIRFGLVTWKTK
jgi:hypothetical protein